MCVCSRVALSYFILRQQFLSETSHNIFGSVFAKQEEIRMKNLTFLKFEDVRVLVQQEKKLMLNLFKLNIWNERMKNEDDSWFHRKREEQKSTLKHKHTHTYQNASPVNNIGNTICYTIVLDQYIVRCMALV